MTQPKHPKPVGEKSALRLDAAGTTRLSIQFPADKEEREWMIARIFAKWSEQFPKVVGPVTIIKKNPESDLDFTIQTAAGERQLELAEFAPLHRFGNSYANVPANYRYTLGEMGQMVCEAIDKKSERHGGAHHWLLLYVTHGPLFVTPPTVEVIRRKLLKNPPRFERIFALSPADATSGTAMGVYPTEPHSMFARFTDEALAQIRITVPNLHQGSSIIRFRGA